MLLATRLERLGLSLEDFARLLDVHRITVDRWCVARRVMVNGQTHPIYVEAVVSALEMLDPRARRTLTKRLERLVAERGGAPKRRDAAAYVAG